MEKRRKKKDKNKENVVTSAVEKEKKKAGITELDFKQLRICLQQILNKINGLMLPLIKNCKNDKAAMFLSCLATDICVGLSSWVEVDGEKEYEESADKVELQHLFDVLRFWKLSISVRFMNFTLLFRENKRWMQCQFAYNRAKEKGITVNLKTFMVRMSFDQPKLVWLSNLQNAMLRPDDIETIMKRVQQKKVRVEYFTTNNYDE